MRQGWTVRAAAFLCVSTLFAQAPASKPTFEAADVTVHARSSNANPGMRGGVLRAGRYDLRNASMLDLIVTAYGVNVEAVVGGPIWLERDRFDIAAKAPQSTPPEALRVMLQNLLADRFQLVVRNENKEIPGLALTVGPGRHKMKETAAGGSGCQPVLQTPEPGTVPYNVAACRGITMKDFAQLVRAIAGAYVEQTVTDATGLQGAWDFDLKWTQRPLLTQAGSDGISMQDALEKQLGLKLEPKGIVQPVLTVVSVNQRPAQNPSGVAQNVPSPPPAEFDVADIKLSPPGSTDPPSGRLQPGGRVNFQNLPLLDLVSLAWDIADPELLAAPSWLADTKVSLVARTSEAALGGSADGMQIDIDDVRLMLQALLKERFRMKVHVEDRPVTAYTLSQDRPKLTKADPANRSTCKNGAAPNGRDPRNSNPILSRLVTCLNVTMAEFAEDLPRMASGYLRTPVKDDTGLEGRWDLTFNFSPVGVAQPGRGGGVRDGGGAAPAPAAPPPSSDPNGAVTLFDAIRRQLGLKLEMQKRPLPVVIIDEMERKPIDN